MTKRLATAIQKGGTGKTTTAINLGAALAEQGKDVLLVDIDEQANLTEGLGLEQVPENQLDLSDFLLKNGVDESDLGDIIVDREPFGVIPASDSLEDLSEKLGNLTIWYKNLSNLFDELENGYDWIIVDTPPKLDRVTDSALIATKHLVVPLLCQPQSEAGVIQLYEKEIKPINQQLQDHGEDPIEIVAMIPNWAENDNERDRIHETLNNNFSDQIVREGFEIRKRIALGRAWDNGKTLFEYDPENDMCDRFLELADYVEKEVDHHE